MSVVATGECPYQQNVKLGEAVFHWLCAFGQIDLKLKTWNGLYDLYLKG